MYDTPFSIKYIGFTPDPQLDSYAKFLMYNVIDYCPYDSLVSLQILALSNLFLVNINVKYVHAQFQGLGEESSVEAALGSAEKSLLAEIKIWRSSRFNPRNTRNERPLQKISVLVVDDDPLSTKLIEACLNKQGCEVYKVNSGDEALFTIQSQDFNFVVMDWHMRPLNGRQTLKALDSSIHVNQGIHRNKIPVLTYSVSEEDDIHFPRTDNLYQFAHLSKTSSIKRTYEITKRLVDQFNSTSAESSF